MLNKAKNKSIKNDLFIWGLLFVRWHLGNVHVLILSSFSSLFFLFLFLISFFSLFNIFLVLFTLLASPSSSQMTRTKVRTRGRNSRKACTLWRVGFSLRVRGKPSKSTHASITSQSVARGRTLRHAMEY